MSIDELIREVSSIETSSKEMTSRVAAAAQSLSTSNTALTSLVRGNKKGRGSISRRSGCIVLKKSNSGCSQPD